MLSISKSWVAVSCPELLIKQIPKTQAKNDNLILIIFKRRKLTAVSENDNKYPIIVIDVMNLTVDD